MSERVTDKFIINQNVKQALTILEKNKFDAYVVGGCVRDVIMGKIPNDFDVCTNATPEQILECFKGYKCVLTGIRHGTVTVIFDDDNIEITTFRSEYDYADHRHPNEVVFETDIKKDLSRRDFTINAIAYSMKKGLLDPFHGQEDIKKRKIRAVGNPFERFNEDCLRMLRALRFSATLCFEIEEETAVAIKNIAKTIHYSSKERQSQEFRKMILGRDFSKVIREQKELIFEILPELRECENCTQETKYHKYNVLEHSIVALENCENNLILKMVMLLHDIGKPHCKTIDENKKAHFKGHAQKSSEMAKDILTRLCFSNKEIKNICQLISLHYAKIYESKRQITYLFKNIGTENAINLMKVIYYDTMGKSDFVVENDREKALYAINTAINLSEQNACYKISMLAIGGEELMKIGVYQGEKIGAMLNRLLCDVIDGKVLNDKLELIQYAITLAE